MRYLIIFDVRLLRVVDTRVLHNVLEGPHFKNAYLAVWCPTPDEKTRFKTAVERAPLDHLMRVRLHDHHILGPGNQESQSRQFSMLQNQLRLETAMVIHVRIAGSIQTLPEKFSYDVNLGWQILLHPDQANENLGLLLERAFIQVKQIHDEAAQATAKLTQLHQIKQRSRQILEEYRVGPPCEQGLFRHHCDRAEAVRAAITRCNTVLEVRQILEGQRTNTESQATQLSENLLALRWQRPCGHQKTHPTVESAYRQSIDACIQLLPKPSA